MTRREWNRAGQLVVAVWCMAAVLAVGNDLLPWLPGPTVVLALNGFCLLVGAWMYSTRPDIEGIDW